MLEMDVLESLKVLTILDGLLRLLSNLMVVQKIPFWFWMGFKGWRVSRTFLRKPMNGADFCFPKERTFDVLSKMIWGYLLQVLLDFLKNVREKKVFEKERKTT